MWKMLRAAAIVAASAGCAADPIPPAPPPEPARDWWIFFDAGSTAITPTGGTTISNFAQVARKATKPRIILTGHTDRSGGRKHNMALSLRRAEVVKKSLVEQGIPADAIETVGRGETQPLVRTRDGVKEPQNRRVEFVIN